MKAFKMMLVTGLVGLGLTFTACGDKDSGGEEDVTTEDSGM